jgi:hypothetical protein
MRVETFNICDLVPVDVPREREAVESLMRAHENGTSCRIPPALVYPSARGELYVFDGNQRTGVANLHGPTVQGIRISTLEELREVPRYVASHGFSHTLHGTMFRAFQDPENEIPHAGSSGALSYGVRTFDDYARRITGGKYPLPLFAF